MDNIDNEQKLRVGISIHYINLPPQESYFHWNLCYTDTPSWYKKPVYAARKVAGPTSGPAWKVAFREVEFEKSGSFRGVIHLFSTSEIGLKDLESHLLEIGAAEPAPDQWAFPGVPGPSGWTCAAWILWVMDVLSDALWDMPDGVPFAQAYAQVLLGAEILDHVWRPDETFKVLSYETLEVVSGSVD
ncbi:hypothetical protein BDZ89DRAFT_1206401 [Hymenopellis radicata]|nr:hypothetical protein BDZ89DRAFT_1206401 [Hymenopellis radicata]